MRFEVPEKTPAPPKRLSDEQQEYDGAIAALIANKKLAIEVEPEGDPKSIKTKLTYAATRAGVKVKSWYDPDESKVFALIKTPLPAA